jgi:hypothetical protein
MSHRNFGVISGRLTTGARHQPSASRANSTLRDLYIPNSILPPADAPLPSHDLSQALFDVVKVCKAFLLITFTGIAVAFGAFILFFVHVH